MPVLSHGAAQLWAQQVGEGEDVLLIAGLADEAAAWDAQVAALSAHARVTTYDARGVGSSNTPPGPYRFGDLVADAVAVLDGLAIERAHVVASSLGGAIAQRLAIDHPRRVASLVLSGTWARPDRAFTALIETWIRVAQLAAGPADLLAVVNRAAFGPGAWNDGRVDAWNTEAVAAFEADPQAWPLWREAFIATARALLEHRAGDAELAAIRVPVLLLVGEDDAVLPARYSQRLAVALPEARVARVTGAGHQPFQEAPAEFNRLVESFLASVAQQPVTGRVPA